MKVTVNSTEGTQTVSVREGMNVLDILQQLGVEIYATCGGHGSCGRCRVLIRDDTGLNWKLACTTLVQADMEITVEDYGSLSILEDGATSTFLPTKGKVGYGMSVDVGTTTIVAHLYDLATGTRVASATCSNPQIVFGSDVISRITASIEGKFDLLVNCLQDALRELRQRLCKNAGIETEQITKTVIAGNTIMQHFVCGLRPDSIGASPFTPLSLFGDYHRIEGLGDCYLVPALAGYVGGDISAGLLMCNYDEQDTGIFLDLGTNGEMALAHRGHIACCATAAGPVFEGATLHFGMPALPGAISSLRYEGGHLILDTIGNQPPIGICGSGIVDALALALELNIIDDTGLLLGKDTLDPEIAPLVGCENDSPVFFLTEDHRLYVTQRDVRNVQLAKAAICSGILTLLRTQNITLEEVTSLAVAGGFGRFLNLEHAARIGLFPYQLLDRARSVGNTSAEGASALLVSDDAHVRLKEIVKTCEYIELSLSKEFNEFFISTMAFE